MFSDDLAAHKSDNVERLCWHRGYVMIYHGGGVTPMAQTCDTDLNQHVRKEYATKEAAELIELMRHGASVPSLGRERNLDLMYEVT